MCFWASLIWFLSCFSTEASVNSNWFNRVWKTDDGLLNNNIREIVQGSDNYLWLVTPVNLMRFDGVNFSAFPVKNFAGVIDPHIRMILRGRTGVLWMVPYNGPVVGLTPDFSMVALPNTGLLTNAPLALAEDRNGALWLGYADVVCRVQHGQVARFDARNGVPAGNFDSMISDGAGNIWLAKGNKICLFQSGRFQRVAGAHGVQCLAATPTNAVWFVAGAHLFSCNTEGISRDHGAFQNPFDAETRTLLEDHAGAVWIGTDGNGLLRYSQSGFERIETSHSSISSIAEDSEGDIWVSTAGGGLNRLSLSGLREEVSEDRLALGQIQAICEDTHGTLWGATHNGALISQVNGKWGPAFTNAPWSGTVTCVAADRGGGIWIGTRNGELLRLTDTNCLAWNQNKEAINRHIFALLPTSNGDMWVIGRQVQRMHEGHLETMSLPKDTGRISAVAEDAAGNIWFGAKGVVLRFDGKTFTDETPRLGVAVHTISCLYGADDGSMWISCGDIGLLQFKKEHLGRVGLDQGLYDDHISQIVTDSLGWLWFAGDRGIFKIRERDLEQAINNPSLHLNPVVYGRNEGLTSLEAIFSADPPYVIPQAILTHDGRVLLLMHTGIVSADPMLLPKNSAAPSVLLTQVAADGQIIASYGGAPPDQIVANLRTLSIPLKLAPAHRHLEFDFTAFHYSAPEEIHFRYQLVGFDNDWIDAGTERNANYSRLPAGNYQFRVAARSGDGPWSETPASLAIAVSPFFWQTWWFRFSALLVFTSSVVAIVRYISFRRLQIKMSQLEQRAALDRERTRIARDLHDDLGCSLNKVALTMEMMQRRSATLSLTKIQHCWTMVREVASSVNDIVWTINPRNDTLRDMLDYFSHFAAEYLQAADIPCLMELPDNIPKREVSPEARHNLLLAVKEGLNNIVRHAGASEVHLNVVITDNQVSIIIKDNGRGFTRPPENALCDGLRNMRQRMDEIGGQFQLESQPGAGTTLTFVYGCPVDNKFR